jgi:hypothetical protein
MSPNVEIEIGIFFKKKNIVAKVNELFMNVERIK